LYEGTEARRPFFSLYACFC